MYADVLDKMVVQAMRGAPELPERVLTFAPIFPPSVGQASKLLGLVAKARYMASLNK